MNDALEKSSRFHPPADIYELADYASEILSLCNSMGEGGCSPLRWWSSFAPAARTWCAALRLFAEPRGWARPPLGSCAARYPESNIVAGTTTRCERGEPAQPHQAHDRRGQGEWPRRRPRPVPPGRWPATERLREPETVAASVEVETTEVVG